ncbi:hypothetical protein GCM10011316_15340 [Roseibium aquae]|uniref:AsmA-like protein n=1 Tax=Roseibium aquae TaxID=1323746 RepID=A0A916TGM2_9HYPH|nr:AsmA-like C-terminal domain-containing protein [Roseibium aquae]GGB44260.1 hypothetical protein GCM10011316_15340 [Roseibium aquae]
MAKTRHKTRRTFLNWGLRLFLVMVLVVVAMTAFIGFRLATGPVSVPFLASYMGDAASEGTVQLKVFDAALARNRQEGLKIIVREAHLTVSGETTVEVFLPRVEAPLNLLSLLTGQLHFQSLLLDQPKVRLGASVSDTPAVPDMASLVEAVDRVSAVVDEEFARRELTSIKVVNGEVVFEGLVRRQYSGIDAMVERSAEGRIRAQADVAGQAGPWDLTFVRQPDEPEQGFRRIGLSVRDITIREFLDPDVQSDAGKGLGLPVDLTFDSYLTGAGGFQAANLVGRMRNGWFQVGDTTVAVEDAALSLLWQSGRETIEITRSHLAQGQTRIELEGIVTPPEVPGGAWTVSVGSDNAQFGSADIPGPPMRIDTLKVNARVQPLERSVFIDRFRLRAGEADLLAVGSVDVAPDGPYLALAAHANEFSVALAKQVWPITLVPPARNWVIQHVHEGLIEEISFTGALRPPVFDSDDPDPGWGGNDIRMDMRFSGGRITPIGEVPDAVGLSGTLTVADETLTLSAQDAVMGLSSPEKPLALEDVSFQIFDLPLRVGKTARFVARLDGAVSDIGTIVDSPPFQILERAGLQNNGVSGESSMRVEAAFSLDEDIALDEVDWKAEAVSRDFAAQEPIGGQIIRNADVTLRADPTQVSINGRGNLNGFDADIDLQFPLGESSVETRQGVGLTVTAAQLKERGIDLTEFLSGPMRVQVSEGETGRKFEIDMTKARIDVTSLGWRKERGVPAQASFMLDDQGADQRIDAFRLTADGVEITGRLRLSPDGGLRELTFDRFHLRPDDQVALEAKSVPDGYQVRLAGQRFDARGLIRQMRAGEPEGTGKGLEGTLDVTLAVDRVLGFNGARIDGVNGRLRFGADRLQTAQMSGQLNGREPFEFTLAAVDGGRRADGRFGDTGVLLSFLDLYERMRGGAGNLEISMRSDKDWTGLFSVRNLSITNDPAIEKLRQRQDLLTDERMGRVLIPGRDKAAGDAGFETLELAFTRSGDTLTITRGALQGAVFGGTVSGQVDLAGQQMNLSGTFVPIYALNNIFANIPVLGFALGGNTGEGLLGVTYRLSGPLTDPVLTVNPVSAIAPGIFRKMFEFQ